MNKEIIENFFDYWCRSIRDSGRELKQGEPTHKELYNKLLDPDIRKNIILKDEELKQETYDRYFANRIFLTALLVKPEHWSKEFVTRLSDLLSFLKNKPEEGEILYSKFLQSRVAEPIEKLLTHIQSGKTSDTRADIGLTLVMPQDAVTRGEWYRIGNCLDEKQFQTIYQQNRNLFNPTQRNEMLKSAVLASEWYSTVVPDIVKDMIEKKEMVPDMFFYDANIKKEIYALNPKNIELWKMLALINRKKQNILQAIEIIEEMLRKNFPIQSKYDVLSNFKHSGFDLNGLFTKISITAAKEGHLAILKFLIEEKKVFMQVVKPIQNDHGLSPLVQAIAAGHMDIVNYLLSLPPPINSINREGPRLAVEAANHKNLEVLKILAEKKVDLSIPFNRATVLVAARDERNIPILLFLAEKGISIDNKYETVFDEERTLAVALALERNIDGLKKLEKHLNFNYSDEHGRNLIYLFICDNSWISEDAAKEMIQFLVSKGVDINKKDQNGFNALLHAVDQGSLEKVKVLIEFKADIKSPYRSRNLENPQNITLLHHAVCKGHTEIIEYLIEKGIDIHHQDDNKVSALFWAAQYGQTKAFQLLAEYGADVNNSSIKNTRAVHFAAHDKNLDLLQLLAEYKADFNVVTTQGKTPLDLAIEKNFPEGVELLLKL